MEVLQKIAISLAVAIVLGFSGCGSSDGDSDESETGAVLADANIDTASKFLGSSYQLNAVPKVSSIEARSEIYTYNPYGVEETNIIRHGSNGGTRAYSSSTNQPNKTFTSQKKYLSYDNKSYDSVCDKYSTTMYNGNIDCIGDYSSVIEDKYYLKNKKCTFTTPYTKGNGNYNIGGTKTYNYEEHTIEKNYTIIFNNGYNSKQDRKYYYKQDADTKTYKIYDIAGKYYFDNATKYLKVDTIYNAIGNITTFDLCNGSVYSGTRQFIAKDNIKMRFKVIEINKVLVEKSSDEITWNNIGIFSKT